MWSFIEKNLLVPAEGQDRVESIWKISQLTSLQILASHNAIFTLPGWSMSH